MVDGLWRLYFLTKQRRLRLGIISILFVGCSIFFFRWVTFHPFKPCLYRFSTPSGFCYVAAGLNSTSGFKLSFFEQSLCDALRACDLIVLGTCDPRVGISWFKQLWINATGRASFDYFVVAEALKLKKTFMFLDSRKNLKTRGIYAQRLLQEETGKHGHKKYKRLEREFRPSDFQNAAHAGTLKEKVIEWVSLLPERYRAIVIEQPAEAYTEKIFHLLSTEKKPLFITVPLGVLFAPNGLLDALWHHGYKVEEYQGAGSWQIFNPDYIPSAENNWLD